MAQDFYICVRCGWRGSEYECFPDDEDEEDGCPRCGSDDLMDDGRERE